VINGDLTIRDRTHPIVLAVEYQGQIRDTEGKQRAAFTGITSLSRKDFGITWNQRLDGGGVVVGDTVKVALDISAVRQR
jgi:polyisoprenoid-binding protein YceI